MQGKEKDQTLLYLQRTRKLIRGEMEPTTRQATAEEFSGDTNRLIRELQTKSILKQQKQETGGESTLMSERPLMQSQIVLQSHVVERHILETKSRGVKQGRNQMMHSSYASTLRQQVAHEKEEQQQAHLRIAEYLQKFDECKNRQLPLIEIYRQCHRNPDLRDNEQTLWTVSSSRAQIRPSALSVDFGALPPILEEQFGQYSDDEQSELGNRMLFEQTRSIFIQKFLDKANNLKILESFLKDIINKQDSIESSKLNVPELNHEVYAKLEQRTVVEHKGRLQQMFRLDELFLTNYVPIHSITGHSFFAPEVITQRVANKRSGSSLTFHPRTFVLSGKQLLYYGDSDKNVKKMLTIVPQQLQLTAIQKQIGGFFSRQKKLTKMFTVRGETRSLQIEYSQLEGAEMYRQLCQHFSLKAYKAYCGMNEVVEHKFQRFIRSSQCSRLDLSDNTLKYTKGGASALLSQQFMGMWMKGLEHNKSLKEVDLHGSRLDHECIELVLTKLVEALPGITFLDISQNPLNRVNLMLYIKCLNQFAQLTTLNLSRCELSDSLVEATFLEITTTAERLLYIDISHNSITHISVPAITRVLQRVQLAEFVADGLQLGDSSVSQFLSDGIELSALSMNGCGINLNDSVFAGITTRLSRNTSIRRLSLQRNLCTISEESFQRALKDSKSLQELRLDIPQNYYSVREDPTNDWRVDQLY